MVTSVKAIRGMNDILPEQAFYWQYIEDKLRAIAESYAYQEIRFPLIEHTELFTRTIGEVTDIVTKEMYTFVDRNGDSLTLRPEGTAGCVRAGIEQGFLYNQIQRLWYMGQMFRHERPQKGRYRQFHQFGVEVFGLPGPDIDAEHIFIMARLFKTLGIGDEVILQINSLGNKATRTRYHIDLEKYFTKHIDILDDDSKRRLHSNPLRILDSKNPALQDLITNAPKLLDYLDENSKIHFAGFKRLLDAAGIKYEINPRLVRGLDYYCLTVYEWVTKKLGAQNAICAGGRYDGLVAQLGGKATLAIGFALGLERLVELVAAQKTIKKVPDVYLITVGDEARRRGLLLAEQLRSELPNLSLLTYCGTGNYKTQFKQADKSGARIALVIGDEELKQNVVAIKYLREDKPQENVKVEEIIKFL